MFFFQRKVIFDDPIVSNVAGNMAEVEGEGPSDRWGIYESSTVKEGTCSCIVYRDKQRGSKKNKHKKKGSKQPHQHQASVS